MKSSVNYANCGGTSSQMTRQRFGPLGAPRLCVGICADPARGSKPGSETTMEPGDESSRPLSELLNVDGSLNERRMK